MYDMYNYVIIAVDQYAYVDVSLILSYANGLRAYLLLLLLCMILCVACMIWVNSAHKSLKNAEKNDVEMAQLMMPSPPPPSPGVLPQQQMKYNTVRAVVPTTSSENMTSEMMAFRNLAGQLCQILTVPIAVGRMNTDPEVIAIVDNQLQSSAISKDLICLDHDHYVKYLNLLAVEVCTFGLAPGIRSFLNKFSDDVFFDKYDACMTALRSKVTSTLSARAPGLTPDRLAALLTILFENILTLSIQEMIYDVHSVVHVNRIQSLSARCVNVLLTNCECDDDGVISRGISLSLNAWVMEQVNTAVINN